MTTAVVRLNEQAISRADSALDWPLHGDALLTMKNYTLTNGADSTTLTWKGEKPSQTVSLTSKGQTLTGLIYTGDAVYSVEPLGKGLQACTKLDQRKFKEDHPPAFHKMKTGEIKFKNAADAPATPTPGNTAVIRVLVAYTPKVEGLRANVLSFVDACVDLSNFSYANSRIAQRLELAHTVKVTYNESGSHEKDLAWFQKDMTVAKLRKQHMADVCVLLTTTHEYCGLAAAILATRDTAFVVVDHACAIDNLSFPHELGHLQGARHDWGADPTNDAPPYPWNHGFQSTKGNWRTIMAYPTDEQPIRLPYWSNPAISYGNPFEPMGTPNKHHNAQMLSQSANYVSAFRYQL